ncbi:hypothetical protein C7B67_09000 [filamentous cyanobacterium Phorm 6]|nr:hypothetical protein C7B67_09000 [filamentous cyanobacterium Phorm 6]
MGERVTINPYLLSYISKFFDNTKKIYNSIFKFLPAFFLFFESPSARLHQKFKKVALLTAYIKDLVKSGIFSCQ